MAAHHVHCTCSINWGRVMLSTIDMYMYVCTFYACIHKLMYMYTSCTQALFFGGGWVFFMRKLFKNFEVHMRIITGTLSSQLSMLKRVQNLCECPILKHAYSFPADSKYGYSNYLLCDLCTLMYNVRVDHL